jgi:hypothetical protein
MYRATLKGPIFRKNFSCSSKYDKYGILMV